MNKVFKTAMATALVTVFAGCVLDSKVSEPLVDAKVPDVVAVAGDSFRVFAMGQDFTSKKAVLDRVAGGTTLTKSLKDWGTSDVILAADGDSLFALNRKAGTVTGFTHGDVAKVFLDVQMTGPKDDASSGANPYAVARIGQRLWVACYGSPYLKAVDLSSQKLVDSIDLSSWAFKGASNPQTVDVHAWRGKLVVTLGRLDGWNPGDTSMVLVLDPSSKAVVKRIALPWNNPYGISWRGDSLLVACVGKWTNAEYTDILMDGGLALVDLGAGTAKAILSEQTAGANLTDAEWVSGTKAFVGLGHADYSTTLAAVSLVDGKLGAPVAGIKAVAALAWNGKSLWVAEQNKATPTLFKVDSTGVVAGTFATTLAPGSLALLP